jgi:hypothetical protein
MPSVGPRGFRGSRWLPGTTPAVGAGWSRRRRAGGGEERRGRPARATWGERNHGARARTGATGGGPDVGEVPDRGEGEAGVRERLHDGAGVPGRRQVVRPVGVPGAVARLVGVRGAVDLAMAHGLAQTPLATHLCTWRITNEVYTKRRPNGSKLCGRWAGRTAASHCATRTCGSSIPRA